MQILQITKEGHYMNTTEEFHTYTETKNGTQLKDKHHLP
jgi:hypothetical protein